MYRNHLEKLARARLDDVLLDEGLIDRGVAEDALAEQEMTGRLLSEILMERQAIDEWDLAKVVATHYGLPFVDVKAYDIPREARGLLSSQFCRERLILPLDTFGHTATFAVVEMPRFEVIAEIERLSGKSPFLYVGVRRPIVDTLDEWDAIERKKSGRPARAAAETATPARPASAGDAASDATGPDTEAGADQPHVVMAPIAAAAPEPTALVPPPNQGVLGALPALTLALGPAPVGVGVDVVTAGAIGRMTNRPGRDAAPAAAPTDPGAPPPGTVPAAVEAPSNWQSIFDEADSGQ